MQEQAESTPKKVRDARDELELSARRSKNASLKTLDHLPMSDANDNISRQGVSGALQQTHRGNNWNMRLSIKAVQLRSSQQAN
jgi:hypothetical protein